MAVKHAPVAWVSPTPFGVIHVVTDADPSIVYWVSSMPVPIPTGNKSVRNGPSVAEGSAGDGYKTLVNERTFRKWWNFVFFTPYRDVFDAFGPDSEPGAMYKVGFDPKYITIIGLRATMSTEEVQQLVNSGSLLALGIQGEIVPGDSRTDPAVIDLFRNYKDPFRDPTQN